MPAARVMPVLWLGAPPARLAQLATTVRSRYPVYAVEGCDKRCAGAWLAAHGVRPQRRIIVRP